MCDRSSHLVSLLSADLAADPKLACDSDEYRQTKEAAWMLVCLYPVGVPVMYGLLIWASRRAIRTSSDLALVRHSAFLWNEYSALSCWWEPLEMCRKLVLTGWILMIAEEHAQLRALVALATTVGFLTLRTVIKPYRRPEDHTLVTLMDFALVLVYVSVLLIKACESSVEVCKAFGFGETAEGASSHAPNPPASHAHCCKGFLCAIAQSSR
eukprot:2581930-Prymnesium_polylepis.1